MTALPRRLLQLRAAALAVPLALAGCVAPNVQGGQGAANAPAAAPGSDVKRTAAAAAGRTTHLFGYSHMGSDCRSKSLPTVDILTQPSHGTVDVRETVVTAATIRSGRTDCLGTTTNGVGVFYTPAAGFTGVDRLRYSVQSPSMRARTFEVTIGVR